MSYSHIAVHFYRCFNSWGVMPQSYLIDYKRCIDPWSMIFLLNADLISALVIQSFNLPDRRTWLVIYSIEKKEKDIWGQK